MIHNRFNNSKNSFQVYGNVSTTLFLHITQKKKCKFYKKLYFIIQINVYTVFKIDKLSVNYFV